MRIIREEDDEEYAKTMKFWALASVSSPDM